MAEPGAADQDAIQAVLGAADPYLWLVTAAHGGARGGCIATYVNGASIVPALPRVVLGLARHHHTWGLVEDSGRFALHLLGQDDLAWVWRFGAASGHDGDKFQGLELDPGRGAVPLLRAGLGALQCRVEERLDTGDRTLYLAAVESARCHNDGAPLTQGQALARAPSGVRERLAADLARDRERDREAILDWRRQQGVDWPEIG